MGIPSFASRMRGYGSVGILSRREDSQTDRAIIDGPSMAHSLLQQTDQAVQSYNGTILPTYSYCALGEAAVTWLKNLEKCGFQV